MGTRLGAIGLGGLGSIELDILADNDGVEVVAGSDVSAESRASFESSYDAPAYESERNLLDEHGDELDAACIVTPHTLHHEQAMACLEAGLDVFVEKPMVTGVEEAVELVETADELDRHLQVGYQRHFHPLFREMRRVVASGRIGDVHMVNCYLGQEWITVQEGTWRTDPLLSGGGQLYDSGSHLLDALLWTTGAHPTAVAALTDARGHDVDVNAALSIRLEGEAGPITASVGVSGHGVSPEPEEGIVIWGTEGRVDYRGDELRVTDPDGTSRVRADPETTGFLELTERKLRSFVRTVEGDADPAVTGEFGLQVTALTEAAYAAADEGRTVALSDLVDDPSALNANAKPSQAEAE